MLITEAISLDSAKLLMLISVYLVVIFIDKGMLSGSFDLGACSAEIGYNGKQ